MYTEKDLFDFMDAKRVVKVTADTGEVFFGRCWAYSKSYNEGAEDVSEASLEVENISLWLHEIAAIEFADSFRKTSYTQKMLYTIAREKRPVRVYTRAGKVFSGECYVRSFDYNMDRFDELQASLVVNNHAVFQDDIQWIEFLEEST